MLYWWLTRVVVLFLMTALVGCSTVSYDYSDADHLSVRDWGRDAYVVSGAGGMGDGYLFHRDYFLTHYPYYHGYYPFVTTFPYY